MGGPSKQGANGVGVDAAAGGGAHDLAAAEHWHRHEFDGEAVRVVVEVRVVYAVISPAGSSRWARARARNCERSDTRPASLPKNRIADRRGSGDLRKALAWCALTATMNGSGRRGEVGREARLQFFADHLGSTILSVLFGADVE